MIRTAFPLALLLLLSACVGSIDTPSLLPRPVEATRPDDFAPTPPPVVADAAEVATIAQLLDQAKNADVAFDRALPAGQHSGPEGSEAWITAQSARSAAEIARGPAVDALNALDSAIQTATDKGQDPAALIAARVEVQAIVDRQAERINALSR